MYVARRNPLPTAVDDAVVVVPRRGWRGLIVERNVALLGMTSLVTDISSEMVAVVLPLYLTGRLGFNALQFGAADGRGPGSTPRPGGSTCSTWPR